MSDTLEQVSVEHEGRILTGIDVSEDSLKETLNRHAETPIEGVTEPPPPADASAPIANRNNSGQFAKQTRGQKRFDELTREREDASRARDAAVKERDELKQQLEQARRPVEAPKPEPPPVQAKTETAAPITRGKPTESEVGTKYESYADFVEDLADWKAEQRLAALDFDARIRTSIEADRASRSFVDRYQQTQVEARKVYTDFDAVMESGPGASISLGRTAEQADARVRLIAQLPNTIHVQYAIAKDGDLAARLASMGDVEFGMALAGVAPAAAVASTASTARTVVPIPPPYQPVAGGGSTTVPSSADLAERMPDYDYDKSGYRDKRAKERGGAYAVVR